MAHKKAGGSTKNGRDSNAQRRGVKLYAGQVAKAGSILMRQVGNTFHAGKNVICGKDYTLMSTVKGIVRFVTRGPHKRVFIEVIPSD